MECIMVGQRPALEHSFIRVVCSAEGWSARRAMQNRRRAMSLSLSSDTLAPEFKNFPLKVEVPFTTEAIERLLSPARVSVCLDIQYFDFFPKRDFDEWAFAHQLMGVDRVYAPDQHAYHPQMVTQIARGFVVPTHDMPYRYINETGNRTTRLDHPSNTSYMDKEFLDRVYQYLCLHEHWYDDWIGVAWTPDEYLTFDGFGLPPPTVRTNMVADAIEQYVRFQRDQEIATNEWRFCVPELCMNRPFYAPKVQLSGEKGIWTLPGDGMQVKFGTGGELAVERYTKRYSLLSRSSSNRKCFVHSDWRLSAQVKLHGFPMDSCPGVLSHDKACKAGKHPHLREACLGMCGYFGRQTCNQCIAPPAPGCGRSSPRDITQTEGPIMQGIELAHFRVAPKENTQSLSRYTTWLSNMSKTLRPLVDAANPSKPPRYPGRHVANAYLAEAERLTRATAASRVPAVAIESAKREARDHAVALGHLLKRRGAANEEPMPHSLEGLQAAVHVLQHHLAHAMFEYQEPLLST